MAKKEKVTLTPEEIEAKKARKKEKRGIFGKTFERALAWFLAVVFVYCVAFIASGKTATVAAPSSANQNNVSTTKAATKSEWDTSANGNGAGASDNNSAAQSGSDTAKGDTAQGGSTAVDTASIIKKLNDATSKASSAKAGYDYDKETEYVPGQGISVTMFGGNATNLLNGIIKGVADGADLDSVVGNFIGIGGKKATVAKGQDIAAASEAAGVTLYDYEVITGSKLTAENVTSATMNGNKITLALKDAETPQSGDGSSLANLTEDFLTLDRVNKAISDGLGGKDSVTVQDSSTVTYSDIKVDCELDDNGNLVSYKISYRFTAALDIKAGVTIKGSGAADSVISYSNFKY